MNVGDCANLGHLRALRILRCALFRPALVPADLLSCINYCHHRTTTVDSREVWWRLDLFRALCDLARQARLQLRVQRDIVRHERCDLDVLRGTGPIRGRQRQWIDALH